MLLTKQVTYLTNWAFWWIGCNIQVMFKQNYRKTSSISRIKSQNFNVSCILLQLFSLNPLKPCVKLRMKM